MASNTWKVLLFSTFVLLVDLSAGQTLPDLSECGRSVGCFRNPPNCMTSDNCTSVVRWYKTNDSNYIGFDLMAVSDGWVAVGLSMDKSMGSDSVVRCIRNSSDNDAVSVSLGYNNGTYNYPYMPSNGMQYVNGQTGSYINGRVTCSFQRSIIGDNVGVYALNNSYYLLLGFGPANAGVLQPHMEYPQISPIMVSVVTDFQDVSNSIMVSDGSGSQATFTSIPGTNRVLIKMTSTAVGSSGWLGLGFSYDQVMVRLSNCLVDRENKPRTGQEEAWLYIGHGEYIACHLLRANDSVIGCILMINGTLIVKHSYNNFHSNMDIPNAYDGITNAILSNTNGLLQCVFEREINGLRNSLIYSLDRPYYILIARGPVDDQGTKQYHSNHFVTPQTITVANSSSSSPMGYSYFSDDDGNSAAFRYLSNSSEIEFQITGPVSGTGRWIALGFSDDNQMGNDSVLDCILQRNGTTVVQHSYNYNDSTRNFALNSSAGIRVIGTSYQNGVFNCSFRRNVTGFTDQRIFSLDNLFYLLLARGPVSDDGIKLQHDKLPIASSNAVDLRLYGNVTRATIAPSTSGVSYFNDPNSGDAVQFMLSTNGAYVEFTIQRPSPTNGSGWVAVGFNDIGMMANSSIIDCILMSNGTFRVQLSYNRPINHSNEEIGNPDSAIIDIVTENANGIMKCNLKRKVSGFSDNRIFPFTKQYHLLLASGALRPDGQTKGYHFTTRVPSSTTFNLTSTEGQTSQEATTASTPPATPGWSSFNDPNSGNTVQFMLSTNGTYVEFTIQGPSPPGGSGWVAVGFNDIGMMVNSSVIDCILTSNGTFKVQLSYNDPAGTVNEEIGNPDSAIIDVVTENANGIMKCNLKRKVSGFSDNRIFPFTKLYYLLLASGPLNPDGTKAYHMNKVPSKAPFNLTSTEGQNASETGCHTNSQRLLRAHGSLMITTFVMLMSGAIIVARYYKTCWPDDKICGTGVWFAVHRFLMVIGLFCCAAGFIIIFCYSSGFICRSFPSGSPSYYWVHGPLGIVVMCLIIINPIMALLRCDPDHHLRWIYNWLHFFVGMSCQILAGITLFFGIKMGELKYNLNHWSVFWILIAFVAFHVFIEFVLMIERLISQRFTKQSFTVSYGMSAIGEEPSAVKAGSGVASRESLVFRYCVLTLYTAVTMGLWLAMIIMIGGGFYTSSS